MRTTIKLKGVEFPLYETKRGGFDFEKHGYSMNEIQQEKASALQAYVFFSVKACAKIEKRSDFPYLNLDAFVDDEGVSLMEIAEAFVRMTKKEAEPGEAKPEATPAKTEA